MEDNSQNVE
jgi:hypothetical protein